MKPIVILGQECRVTASIGVCLHPVDGQDDHAIMKNADMAMYLAKEEGKNNFRFFTSGMNRIRSSACLSRRICAARSSSANSPCTIRPR